MKMLVVSIFVLMAISAQAKASSAVFECTATLKIDDNESLSIGITVVQESSDYISYLVGSSETGPLSTLKQTVAPEESLQIGGVKEIITAAKMSPQDFSKVAKVTIYTAGNFDDDAAGVRTAEFIDAKDVVLAKGMFFGWGGPVSCQ